MANSSTNPLYKHFRQPAIYLKLPSQGKFWSKNSIEIPESGEIPVYPMTVKDEITIKTPDALMNGSGVAEVIHSCCPSIKDAWNTPAIDIDVILISMRIASYGAFMDLDTECPNCTTENTHSVDLRVVLDDVKVPDYNEIQINNLNFQFKPQTFKDLNNNNLLQYEQQRLISTISNSELTEEQKLAEFQKVFPRLTELNVLAIVNSIESITVDNNVVNKVEFIREFINNCDRKMYDDIKQEVEKLSNEAKIKPFALECTNCNHQYSTEIIFDQSNFFA